ncbi:NADP-dependent malic enzyme [Escherichia coli]|uniref:NADP-dependent malic enzyme n=1 Tax=Escherichia coli TaxID=562 RepID=A0A376REZ4_ECOLX|nr:NADP-dependent malic enzyme [Escherichia coli]
MRIQKLGLQIKAGVDFEIVNNESDPRFKEYWTEYFQIMKRRGVTQEQAQRALISNPTVIGRDHGSAWGSRCNDLRYGGRLS